MGHAASPSLISLGLTADISTERSTFRWGIATSTLFHALVLIMAIFLRIQSTNEEPLRAIDVALISLPPVSAPKSTPQPITKPTPPQPAPKPVVRSKPVPQTPAPVVEKPVVQSKPAPKALAPAVETPVEETLPPLSTETATESLSESFGGALDSIVIPQKRESPATSPLPAETLKTDSPEPILGKLQLPSEPPKISRPSRLDPTQPLKIPKAAPPPARSQSKQIPTASAKNPAPKASPVIPEDPGIKPTPRVPELTEIKSFKTPKKEAQPISPQPKPNIQESLKQSLPKISTPTVKPLPRTKKSSAVTQTPKSAKTPKVVAPQLSDIPIKESRPIPTPPPKKMTDTVKELLEGLKSETKTPPTPPKSAPPVRRPINRVPQSPPRPIEKPMTSLPPLPIPSPPQEPVPSEIDERIAKLTIPKVAPIESLKKRLQLLEVPSTPGTPEGQASTPSPGKNRYLGMVEESIDRQWVAPPLLASNPVVVLKFRISRSGEISRVFIDESSGHSHYDAAAKRAVQAVNPLPPFPPDISDSFFDVRFRFIKD